MTRNSSSATAVVTFTSQRGPPSLPILWKEICKRHLHGFTVTRKCPGSLQTLRFHHNLLMRTARVPTLPCYTEAWGRGEMAHGHSKPRSGQDGDSGCLHPAPEACAIQRTPNPPRFRLCPAPDAPEGIQALTYPLPKLVPAGTSAVQSSALHLLMFCCARPEAQTGPLWPLCFLLVHPTQLAWWGSA